MKRHYLSVIRNATLSFLLDCFLYKKNDEQPSDVNFPAHESPTTYVSPVSLPAKAGLDIKLFAKCKNILLCMNIKHCAFNLEQKSIALHES